MSAGASCRFSKAILEKGGWVFRRGQGRIAFAAYRGIAQRIPAHGQLIGALGLFLPVFALFVPVHGNTVHLENAKIQGPVGGKLLELNRRAHGSGQLVQQRDAAAVRILGSGNRLQVIQIPVAVGSTPL